MRVAALLEILRGVDPEAEVYLAIQPIYPFEYALAGVAVREDFEPDEDDGRRPSDVLLLEGTQVRYGAPLAWSAARNAPDHGPRRRRAE